ncbi:MAG: RNA methyltransferase [Bacteroidia bacterium]|nr:RNA methyltransferase [Bacteroidia bacterium]MDW8235188.1 RNA methyltransferase [Bacteroidia bacterium]
MAEPREIKITDERALRRAIESGQAVEKILYRQGTLLPLRLARLVKAYRLPTQQVPATALPPAQNWVAYLSPIPLYSIEGWLAETPQGIALALIGISDPRNVGAILRSAAAFGVKWVLIKAQGSPLLSSEAIWRASAGALPHLHLVREKNTHAALQKLAHRGWHLVATLPPPRCAIPYWEGPWDKPTVLLLGSEEKGLPPDYINLCSSCIAIPHASYLDSLNVSTAAGILLAEAYRRRVTVPERRKTYPDRNSASSR